MYLDHYGLKEAPFSITPDPRYVFLSERHRDALAHLLYGVGKGGSGGFVQLTGEVGTGKTTLCRLLLEQLPENTRVALILNPKLSPLELLEAICEELRIAIGERRGSQKALVDALNTYLLDAYAQGLRVVLIVDEAQNLSGEALEQIRLLTNLETPTQKLLQIILLGQPELRELLARPELRQLAQRITARYHLEPLDAEETTAYVRHRLAVAGLPRVPFSRLGLRTLYQRSGGIPRLINIIADRALMAGYAHEQATLGERTVQRAADEALPGHARYWARRYGRWAPLAAALLVLVALAGWWRFGHAPPPATAAPAIATAPADTAQLTPVAVVQARMAATTDSTAAAWSQLLARWQVRSAEATVAQAAQCQPVIFPGFDCLSGHGTLDQLKRFDRPLILELKPVEGQAPPATQSALLLGVGPRTVRIDYAGTVYNLARAGLDEIWDGRFTVAFRLPADVPQTMQQGDAGPGVGWVAQQLARVDGGTAASYGPAYFDAALEARVRRLQQGYGIRADGIVGPETLFALVSLGNLGPHLVRDVP
ncbi:MAG TPA: AAA family ATPase [Rhodanobacteraceae bacterium]|nr:AAA family ATPase [Rhodanobacteraceae bacterium]